MKILKAALFFTVCIGPFSFSTEARQIGESGPGNGTDYVKVLFADAQYEALRSTTLVEDKDIKTLGLEPTTEKWLLQSVEGESRFQRLKFYLRKMDLAFQSAPCSDGTPKTASICFFKDAEGPYVLISLDENKWTTKDQAMAMLIHEAGHFTGESDHLFLDKVGVQLVNALRAPKILIAESSSTELVPNVFFAKEQCETGESAQSQILRKEALAELQLQCSNRGVSCDLRKVTFIYRGEIEYKPGLGFTMRFTCAAKAVLDLRQ